MEEVVGSEGKEVSAGTTHCSLKEKVQSDPSPYNRLRIKTSFTSKTEHW